MWHTGLCCARRLSRQNQPFREVRAQQWRLCKLCHATIIKGILLRLLWLYTLTSCTFTHTLTAHSLVSYSCSSLSTWFSFSQITFIKLSLLSYAAKIQLLQWPLYLCYITSGHTHKGFTSAVFVCTQMVTPVSRRCIQGVVAFICLDSRINWG